MKQAFVLSQIPVLTDLFIGRDGMIVKYYQKIAEELFVTLFTQDEQGELTLRLLNSCLSDIKFSAIFKRNNFAAGCSPDKNFNRKVRLLTPPERIDYKVWQVLKIGTTVPTCC